VRGARTTARSGLRFRLARPDRAPRELGASVLPLDDPERPDPRRLVLLVDLGRRRVAEELLEARELGLPRPQIANLIEAAGATYSPGAIVGKSPAAARLRARLIAACRSSAPVLVAGERGSGHSFAARTLHYAGKRPGLLLSARCHGRGEEALERELFGHARGAFRGAVVSAPGLVLQARDGTLYLEEIGALAPRLQERVLVLLRERRVQRLGADSPEAVEVRVVASSSQDFESLSAQGRFHPELLAELAAETIVLPPLRERAEDLEELVDRFVKRFAGPDGIRGVEPEVFEVMRGYAWPGNLAELRECVERCCEDAFGGTVGVQHLPRPLRKRHELLRSADGAVAAGASRSNGHLRAPSVAESALPVERPDPPPALPRWAITERDPIDLELYEKKALMRAVDSCAGRQAGGGPPPGPGQEHDLPQAEQARHRVSAPCRRKAAGFATPYRHSFSISSHDRTNPQRSPIEINASSLWAARAASRSIPRERSSRSSAATI